MKYKIRKTKEIVDVVGYSACTHIRFPESDYVCYIDDEGNEIFGRGLNLVWDFEPIDEECSSDWQSFRNQTAKDILCAIIQGGYAESRIEYQSKLSVMYANELVKRLKEKEEK